MLYLYESYISGWLDSNELFAFFSVFYKVMLSNSDLAAELNPIVLDDGSCLIPNHPYHVVPSYLFSSSSHISNHCVPFFTIYNSN